MPEIIVDQAAGATITGGPDQSMKRDITMATHDGIKTVQVSLLGLVSEHCLEDGEVTGIGQDQGEIGGIEGGTRVTGVVTGGPVHITREIAVALFPPLM